MSACLVRRLQRGPADAQVTRATAEASRLFPALSVYTAGIIALRGTRSILLPIVDTRYRQEAQLSPRDRAMRCIS